MHFVGIPATACNPAHNGLAIASPFSCRGQVSDYRQKTYALSFSVASWLGARGSIGGRSWLGLVGRSEVAAGWGLVGRKGARGLIGACYRTASSTSQKDKQGHAIERRAVPRRIERTLPSCHACMPTHPSRLRSRLGDRSQSICRIPLWWRRRLRGYDCPP